MGAGQEDIKGLLDNYGIRIINIADSLGLNLEKEADRDSIRKWNEEHLEQFKFIK